MNVTYKESKTGGYLRLFNKPKPTKGLRGLRQKNQKKLINLKIIIC